jgi:endoglycosylceramidase
MSPHRNRFLAVTVSLAVTVGSLALGAGAGGQVGSPELRPLHAVGGADARIVDAEGRQVLLRGVNLSALGDYYLPNPAHPAPVPLQPDDFSDIAAQGFDVVRLLVHWSALEPTRDAIDTTYLQRIRDAVADAKANNLYVVIDMHQDAWGKYVASPPGTVCSPGTTPAVGWDGAPQWATLFDPGPTNENTCRGDSREDSDAVRAAWDNFYADADGIMSELVELWRLLGAEFADEPAVAGYDLLNEPNLGSDGDNAVLRLGEYYDRAIDAIRDGERSADGFSHMAIFETTVVGSVVPYDFTDDDNIVFSGHNYGDSITPLPMDAVFNYFGFQAEQYDAPLWIGEYGWFDDPPANETNVARYAATEDQMVLGSAWWQWIQACGDPHSIGTEGGMPPPLLIHYKANRCPGDVDLGPVPEWSALTRAYPRAAPGVIRSLASDRTAGTMTITGDGAGTFDLWVPDDGGGTPQVGGSAIGSVDVVEVDGGWRVFGVTCGAYEITMDGGNEIAGECVTNEPDGSEPVAVTPRFTG